MWSVKGRLFPVSQTAVKMASPSLARTMRGVLGTNWSAGIQSGKMPVGVAERSAGRPARGRVILLDDGGGGRVGWGMMFCFVLMMGEVRMQMVAAVVLALMMAISLVGALRKRRGKGSADWKKPGVLAAIAGAMIPGSSQLIEVLPVAVWGFLLCGIMALLGWGVGYFFRPAEKE